MSRSALFLFGFAGVIAAAGAACKATPVTGSSEGGGAPTTSVGGSSGTGKGGAAQGSTVTGNEDITVAAGTGGANAGECDTKDDEDGDKDGWSKADGDCNDCDVNTNPGAIEIKITTPVGDAGIPEPADEDCDGMIDNVAPPCDTGLALTDVDPADAAKAIDLCQTTLDKPANKKDRTWGVLSSKYVSADGLSPRTPGLQVGLLDKYGMNVKTRLGASMLGLSTGHMRTPGQAGFCIDAGSNPSQNCTTGNNGPPPAGFPQAVPGCPAPANLMIGDDIALEVKLRSPTNATGYKFNFKFYSFEYAEWVCTNYNDQFVALVTPPPTGSINGNISFDSGNHPVSVNIAFFDVCDPASLPYFAQHCSGGSCPVAPNPYCPSGKGELLGTGLDGQVAVLDGGGTSWLQTSAPIKGGDDVSVRFTIWDTGDHNLDSSVLIDAFEWIANGGTIKVGTIKPPA
jgi:hypothetical protein